MLFCRRDFAVKHKFDFKFGGRVLLFLTVLVYCLSNLLINTIKVEGISSSNEQIVDIGGSNTAMWDTDGISVSKTIEGTDTEDVFDITLQAKTKQSVEQVLKDESVAVVLVMDLSNTMSSNINGESGVFGSGNTKAELAVSAAQNFISEFYNKSLSYIDDTVGVVGFNTSGVEIEPMTSLDSEATVEALNDDMSNKVISLLSSYAPSGESRRYTNIEAGLKMAKTMLDASSNKYKYVVFLSDGLPTTYTTTQDDTDYTGIDPNGMTDKLAKSLFGTSGTNYYNTQFGTNYSNTGASRARKIATAIKDSGVTIFSVGMGLSTFSGSKSSNSSYPFDYEGKEFLNGQELIMNQLARAIIARVPTVQNGLTYTWDTGSYTTSSMANRYRIWRSNRDNIYNLHWEIARTYDESTGTYSYLPLNSTIPLFENWLKYSIGSGYYYDAVVNSGVQDAIDGILAKINDDLAMRQPEVWTTVDPMAAFDKEDASLLLEHIEFNGFFDQNGALVNALGGRHRLNGENTANFITENVEGNGEIVWDLKNSGYMTGSEGSEATYIYTLKYRVRLKVENSNFVSNKAYKANGSTTLTYVIKNSQGEISVNKTLEYPIPEVKGYLVDLKVSKTVEGFMGGTDFVDSNSTFEFLVSLKDSTGQAIANVFSYDKYDFSDNLLETNQNIGDGGTFTLRNNEYVIIHNLYHGINYSISEVAKDGFVSVASENATGITVSETPLTEIIFRNVLYDVKVEKVDEVNSRPLQGAVFSLYATYRDGKYDDIVTNLNGTELKQLTTDENGEIDLGNLNFAHNADTTYYLVEEMAPNMYVSLDEPVEIIMNAQGIFAKNGVSDLEINKNGNTRTVVVSNKRGDNYIEPEDDVVPNTSTKDNSAVRIVVSFGVGLAVVGVALGLYGKRKA